MKRRMGRGEIAFTRIICGGKRKQKIKKRGALSVVCSCSGSGGGEIGGEGPQKEGGVMIGGSRPVGCYFEVWHPQCPVRLLPSLLLPLLPLPPPLPLRL